MVSERNVRVCGWHGEGSKFIGEVTHAHASARVRVSKSRRGRMPSIRSHSTVSESSIKEAKRELERRCNGGRGWRCGAGQCLG